MLKSTVILGLVSLGLVAVSSSVSLWVTTHADTPEIADLGTLAAQASEIDWVEIPGRCFAMGEDSIYPEEAPVRQACVGRFWISRHEITNSQFARFVAETGYVSLAERGDTETGLPPGSFVFSPDPANPLPDHWWQFREGVNWQAPHGGGLTADQAGLPVVHVTHADAQAYAGWSGARLPSEAEWELAARGSVDGELYAWPDIEAEALSEKANTWQGVFPVFDQARDGYAGLAPVGRYPANANGLFDMIGNVWELTDSVYYPTHRPGRSMRLRTAGMDPAQPGRPVQVIKGGSFLCAPGFCYRYRPAARQAQDAALGSSHIGFRLVRDTPPEG